MVKKASPVENNHRKTPQNFASALAYSADDYSNTLRVETLHPAIPWLRGKRQNLLSVLVAIEPAQLLSSPQIAVLAVIAAPYPIEVVGERTPA